MKPMKLDTIFFSCGSKPLFGWKKQVKTGSIERVTDEEIKSLVIEILGNNVANTFITNPSSLQESLGIKKPIMIMLVKNMKKYFAFQLTVLDNKNIKRKFCCSTYQRKMSIQNTITFMPIKLSVGWNQVQIDMSEITLHAYNSQFVELVNFTINANCRLRRIFFSDKLYHPDQVPPEYKLIIANPSL